MQRHAVHEITNPGTAGREPVAADAVIERYLWRFRPSGQYEAIKDSAKSLRDF